MKILITAAVIAVSLTCASAFADGLRPGAIGCKGFSVLRASELKTDIGEWVGGNPDTTMTAGLIQSGECFPLAGATIKELGEYKAYITRVMAVVPDVGAVKLWTFYKDLHGVPMPTDKLMQMSLRDCVNDCRD